MSARAKTAADVATDRATDKAVNVAMKATAQGAATAPASAKVADEVPAKIPAQASAAPSRAARWWISLTAAAVSALASWRAWVLPLILLALWEWASRGGAAAAYVFVPLSGVWSALLELLGNGELSVHLGASLRRTLQGLAAGTLIGIVTGALMASSRVADRLIGPLYHTLRQVPLLGLVPLIGLWFGSGEDAKRLVVTLAAFYPMTLNTAEALRGVDRRWLEAGRALTLSRWQTFRHIQWPAALPGLFTGFSHALTFAWLSCMGVELLFTAGPGIGSLLMTAENGGRMDLVVVCVLSIALCGYLMNRVAEQLRSRLLRGAPA